MARDLSRRNPARRTARVASLLAWLALPALATAQVAPSLAPPPGPAPETRKFRYSDYEQSSIDGALAALGFSRDGDSEGKIVESIHAVRLEVIEERDPAPRFLNVFHVLTRSYIVDRELLLRPGEIYRQTLADETRRNLASLRQFSLVLVVPAAGSAPDKVRIVVIAKDVWSIRLNWDISFSSGGLESLTLDPTEENLLGTHQSAGARFDWLPLSYSLGAHYAVPRVLGSRVTGLAEAGLTFNTETGSREGSFGTLDLGQPLWSSLTPWSWGVGVAWLDEVTRLYSDGRLASFTRDAQASCAEPSPVCVPFAYRSDLALAAASLTRSFGWSGKHNVTLGFEGRRNRFTPPDLSAFDAATVQAFKSTRVPVSDDRVGPYLQYRTYSTSFLRVLDLETLALQEDYRIGPEAYLRLYPVLRFLGSSRDLLGVSAGLSYTLPVFDGLARAGVESITELETGDGSVGDGSLLTTLRITSPRLTVGRIILDAVLLDRYANHLNRSVFLGGNSRLRGFPSRYFAGSNLLAANVEYRSRPVQLFRSVQLGGTLFYDVGDAFDEWRSLKLWHSAGLGTRILFPQLDRVVFRVDVGFPLSRPLPPGVGAVSFFVEFGQAFSLSAVEPRSAITR
jgi:hypothetical protein